MIFKAEFIPTVEDLGKEGRVSEKAVMRYLENTAAYHSDSVGFGITDIEETGFSWFLTEWRIDFIKPMFYGEKITVETWGRGLVNPRSCARDFRAFNQAGELCAAASSLWSAMELSTMTVERISDDILSPYKCEDISVFDEPKLKRLREPKSFVSQTSVKIRRSDIDLNGHVNNIRYVDLAAEALPETVFGSLECSRIRVSYRREIKVNEDIICRYSADNNTHTVSVYGADGALRSVVSFESAE